MAADTLVPFTFHWYAGVVPPFVGVAVKVTLVPWHTGLAEAAIEMLTGTVEVQELATCTSSRQTP